MTRANIHKSPKKTFERIMGEVANQINECQQGRHVAVSDESLTFFPKERIARSYCFGCDNTFTRPMTIEEMDYTTQGPNRHLWGY